MPSREEGLGTKLESQISVAPGQAFISMPSREEGLGTKLESQISVAPGQAFISMPSREEGLGMKLEPNISSPRAGLHLYALQRERPGNEVSVAQPPTCTLNLNIHSDMSAGYSTCI